MHIRIFSLLLIAGFNSTILAQPQELRIVTSTPNGEVSSLSQAPNIIVTFGEQMIALQEVPTDEGTGPLILEPKMEGKFRWLGTSTLEFTPEKLFPFTTLFTVKIPKGTKSLAG